MVTRDPRWDTCGEPEQTVNMRWIILHMIEETARHAGHLDTARELLDGSGYDGGGSRQPKRVAPPVRACQGERRD